MDAVEKALELKKRDNSEVVVFHSVVHHMYELLPNISFAGASNALISYTIHEDYVNIARKILNDVETRFKDEGLEVETRLLFDILPEDYIKKVAAEENFDLVILGSKGKHSKLREVFLGTIPDRVINEAPCDVLIVR